MKKIVLIFLVFSAFLFANDRILYNIVKNVSIPNTQKAITDAKALQKDFSDKNFTEFIKSWKKVEALYLAGELDSDFIDTPRYIDVFNNIKEDLNSQMQRVLENDGDINNALFKSSYKTVNALEYILYGNKDISERKEQISKLILDSIIAHLEDINAVYKEFLNLNEKDAKPQLEQNALVINTLIASSYRLKEWRVGNASGMSSKYKNDAKNDRAEYFLSRNSFEAIIAILEAHSEIIDDKNYYNLASLAKSKSAVKDIELARNKIKEAQEILKSLKKDDFVDAKDLFASVKELHDAYYLVIIEKLGLSPNILDADGD